MANVTTKRNLNTKSIKERYAALKEVEEGSSKSQVATKYVTPKNALSTWIKNKEKKFESMKTQGNKSKRKRLKQGTFANLDDLIFKLLLTVRSRNVVVPTSIQKKQKPKNMRKRSMSKDFKLLMVGLIVGKTGTMFHSRQYLEKATLAQLNWPHHGRKQLFLQFYPSTNLMKFITQMNLGCFLVCNLISHLIFDLRFTQGENTAKIRLTRMAAANAMGDKIPIFVIGKSKSPCCFEGVKHLPCRYRNQNKIWMNSILLKSGYGKWIQNLQKRRKK